MKQSLVKYRSRLAEKQKANQAIKAELENNSKYVLGKMTVKQEGDRLSEDERDEILTDIYMTTLAALEKHSYYNIMEKLIRAEDILIEEFVQDITAKPDVWDIKDPAYCSDWINERKAIPKYREILLNIIIRSPIYKMKQKLPSCTK